MTDESVFAAALAIPSPADRAAYLDRACAGNPALRKEVEGLLAAHAASNPLDRPPADLARTGAYEPDDGPPPAAVGDRIGPYRLMEQVGEGGFGLVFVAEQTEPVRRKVALKVLKPGMDTREVVARFEAERQALALMDHPNIAKVFDAGTTPQGRPYFVMELVRGAPITDYCDAHKLPPRDRLTLFVQVCQAVQHAHQKGVIHRDIKPSNVLVAPHDGVPVIKVIDFGVAKAVGQSLTDKTIYTRLAQMVGTPLYMSPEQAEVNQLDVDTRADVYALGVLLYELLTGTTPFDRDRFRKAAFDEIRRIIREEEPPKPSTRLTSLGTTLTAVSASRGTDPGRLPGLVRGELDWIVMKCLEKDRNRRYDTAAGLARDVQRYLSGDAVEACPPALGYRLRKLYRRNRAAVLMSGAFAAVLVAAAGVSLAFGVLAVRAEGEAERRRGEADAERARARDSEVEAVRGRNEAVAAREDLRRALYVADMQVAAAAVQTSDVPMAVGLLDRYRPAPGEVDLRGFEWHYLYRRCRPEARSVRIAGKRLVDITPDGTRVLAVDAGLPSRDVDEGSLYLYEAETGRPVPGFAPFLADGGAPLRGVKGAALSDDGRLAVVRLAVPGAQMGQVVVRVIDLATGAVLLSHPIGPVHPEKVHVAASGHRLAIQAPAPGGAAAVLSVWDLNTKQVVWTVPASDLAPLSSRNLALSPDGRWLATTELKPVNDGWQGTPAPRGPEHAGSVRVWDLGGAPGGPAWVADVGSAASMTRAVFSPDARFLAHPAGGGAVVLRDPASGKVLRTLTGPRAADRDGILYFNADGTRLAHSTVAPWHVCVWDLTRTESDPDRPVAARSLAPATIGHLTLGPGQDRITAITTDGVIRSWPVRDPDRLVMPAPPGCLLLATAAPRADRFAAVWESGGGDAVVRVWDADGRVLFEARDPDRPAWSAHVAPSLLLSPDGHRVAYETLSVSDPGRMSAGGRSLSRLKVWDVDSPGLVFEEAMPSDGLPRAAYYLHDLSPDGTRLLVSREAMGSARSPTWPREALLWEVNLGTGGKAERVRMEWFFAARFTPDGRRIICVPKDAEGPRTVTALDAETGREVFRREPGLPPGVRVSTAFSPDSRVLAVHTRSPRREAFVFLDAADGRPVGEAEATGGVMSPRGLLYTPDGRLVVLEPVAGFRVSEAGARLLDPASGRELFRVPIPDVQQVGPSPDGRRVRFVCGKRGGSDVEVVTWDATPLPPEEAR